MSDLQLLRFVVQLAILLAAARLLGELFARLGQPAIAGELLAGIVLGPSLLGGMFPELYEAIFVPRDESGRHILEAFSWLGIMLLLIVAGMETEPRILRRVGRAAAYVTVLGMLIPLLAGIVLGYLLSFSPELNGTAPDRVVFVLFVAVMMTITAVPVLARILGDLGLVRTPIGATILSAAVATDTAGWILLSGAAGLAAGEAGPASLASSTGGVVLFLLLAYLAGRPAVVFLTGMARRMRTGYPMIAVSLSVSFVLAAVTQLLGVHVILGAFIGGILVGQSPHVDERCRRRLESIVMGFFAPIFFATSGLKVDLGGLLEPSLLGVCALVILAASASKLLGGTLGAHLGGIPFWQAVAVGSASNARGSMEVVAATL
ncbi:MAG: cation:proton antiporter, partial [Rubrobacter sp.]|nr:cation:proton antiporter [Rubrobacter sp.]